MKHADPSFIMGKDYDHVRVLSKSDVSEFLGGEEFIADWIEAHNFEYGFEAIKVHKFVTRAGMRRMAYLLGKNNPKQQYLIADYC